ncbi:5'-methylthioadenosine/S-adenosylhomocysteine nucleosidase family protein [Aspergillus brunneoviolaceus CBS 621.78]|uniref:Purine and uridine phosphorylase n=1 Tax=Aspergillus brunneoviolaceus CBS 621.78 TaxID=1450534 RepID=A0ACD1G7Q6_9EURO|nr:purine and uridine phosphorylase [Aspergillus brunneoviolaceus CBS 621.78]RAH45300.1 purine and uridine phosphorylase [Aspergillus brunneoviolaceus CBS 621.78]
MRNPKTREDYTVGWICALFEEQVAATAMLDQIHPDLPKPPNDPNAYTLGSIDQHGVVIACLPSGKYGNNPAGTCANHMVRTFQSVRVVLMVGIGGGIPPKVKLGDVVISTPVDRFSGVIQWDLGKAEKDGKFRPVGSLNNPPTALLTAISKMRTRHRLNGHQIPRYLDTMGKRFRKLVPEYTQSTSLIDPLFRDVPDQAEDDSESISLHYGLIASGNQVIKDANLRDKINQSFDGKVLCIEMEAAALIDNFPCIVIRGICDYADSMKEESWQKYAAAVAAACAKELLHYVQPSEVNAELPVRSILGDG